MLLAEMKAVDLFSGAGGLSIGFERAGYEIIAAYDNWPPAIEVYKNNFPHHRVISLDLNELTDENHVEINILKNQNIDIIFGGPPCQDFSSAGKRNGCGDRGDLTPVFAKIISYIKPKWVLMENVNTILSIGKEKLKECIKILESSGYGITVSVLNAADYGVPQDRTRLFLIGRLNGINGEMHEILKRKQIPRVTVREFMPEIAEGPKGIEYYYRHPRSYARRAIFSIDELSPTIRGVNRPIPGTYKFHKGDKIKDFSLVRPLSYLERARIQTFPQDYKWSGSKVEIEQLIGNAVPPELAFCLAQCIRDYRPSGLSRWISQQEFSEELRIPLQGYK